MIAASFFFLLSSNANHNTFSLPFLSKGDSRTFFWEFSGLSQMLSDIFGTGKAQIDDSSRSMNRDTFKQIFSYQTYETSAPHAVSQNPLYAGEDSKFSSEPSIFPG